MLQAVVIYWIPPLWGTFVDKTNIKLILSLWVWVFKQKSSEQLSEKKTKKKKTDWLTDLTTTTIHRATERCAAAWGKKNGGKKIKEPALERSLWVATWMLADIWSLTIKVGWDSWTRRKRSRGRRDKTRRRGAAVVWGLIPWRHPLRFLREMRPIGWRREKGNDLWRRNTWKRRVNTLIVKNERAQTCRGRTV